MVATRGDARVAGERMGFTGWEGGLRRGSGQGPSPCALGGGVCDHAGRREALRGTGVGLQLVRDLLGDEAPHVGPLAGLRVGLLGRRAPEGRSGAGARRVDRNGSGIRHQIRWKLIRGGGSSSAPAREGIRVGWGARRDLDIGATLVDLAEEGSLGPRQQRLGAGAGRPHEGGGNTGVGSVA